MAAAALPVREGEREGAGTAAASWYLWASATAASRLGATPVAKVSRTRLPGGSRSRWRRLATGSSTAPVVPESGRPSSACGSREVAAAAEEPRPVALPLHRALRPTLETEHVHRPGRGLVGGARPATEEQGRGLGEVLGLDEQLGERGVREIVGGGCEHDLGVARHLDLARPVAVVGHGDSRRTSTSSSIETAISSCVAMPSSRRRKIAFSGWKVTR